AGLMVAGSTPTTFHAPLDVVVNSMGSGVWFSAYNASDQPTIYALSMMTMPPTPMPIFSGSPLELPASIALSSDGSTPFIADPAANATGAIFSVPVAGGMPTALSITGAVAPTAVAAFGPNLVFGGRSSTTDAPGLYIVPQTGGTAALITSSVNDITGITIS